MTTAPGTLSTPEGIPSVLSNIALLLGAKGARQSGACFDDGLVGGHRGGSADAGLMVGPEQDEPVRVLREGGAEKDIGEHRRVGKVGVGCGRPTGACLGISSEDLSGAGQGGSDSAMDDEEAFCIVRQWGLEGIPFELLDGGDLGEAAGNRFRLSAQRSDANCGGKSAALELLEQRDQLRGDGGVLDFVQEEHVDALSAEPGQTLGKAPADELGIEVAAGSGSLADPVGRGIPPWNTPQHRFHDRADGRDEERTSRAGDSGLGGERCFSVPLGECFADNSLGKAQSIWRRNIEMADAGFECGIKQPSAFGGEKAAMERTAAKSELGCRPSARECYFFHVFRGLGYG